MSRTLAAILLILGLAASAGPGCRSFQGNLLRRDVAQAPPKPEQPDPTELVRRVALEHDRRAGLVQSLKVSDLNINIETVTTQAGRDRSMLLGGTAAGVLLMERPKNLRLLLRKPLGMSVADIGSNDREFWFANDLAHEMVVGDYAQTEGLADPFLASIRPGWIFEVLGLEPIPDDVQIEPDEAGATVTLVEQRTLPNGSVMVKESVLSVIEQRIVEHRLYSEGRRELIAQARVDRPVAVPIGPATATEPPSTIELPRVVNLTIPGVAKLRMDLAGIEPNPSLDFASLGSFVQPEKLDYTLVNLFEEMASQPGTTLADSSSAAPAIPPPSRPAPAPSQSPGSLILPRSDLEVARTEDTLAAPRNTRAFAEQPATSGTVALDLPSPGRVPSAEIRRSTWETAGSGNRFPRGVLGRE